jgi:ribosomal protein L12E/L44/L45/RPP1/RPP2
MPLLDDDLRFLQEIEDVSIEEFISEACVEAFAVAVLPRASRFDAGGLCDRKSPAPALIH